MTGASAATQKIEPQKELKSSDGQEPTALKKQELANLFIMFYRHGMNANLTKGFYCEGNLLDARRRAEAHCKVMGYKYIFVRPMVCNLVEEESYKLNGAAEGEIMP